MAAAGKTKVMPPVLPIDLPGIVPNDQGWMHDAEIAIVVGFASILAHARDTVTVLEVGCYKGRTTSGLLTVPQADVVVVDNFKGPPELPAEESVRAGFEANLRERGWSPNDLTIVQGDSVEAMARMRENGESFDIILIDADHTAEGVAKDCAAAWPLLAEGGYLFFDDINWKSVTDGIKAWWRLEWHEQASLVVPTPKLGYVRKVGGRPRSG